MKVPAVLMRGGTSKALFFHERDLPESPQEREKVILAAFGSPDSTGRQIDGVGGGTAETSKVAIISTDRSSDADVTFQFGQVLLHEPRISWEGTCGNISSAVGPFAIDEGLVGSSTSSTSVRFLNTNTGAIVDNECLVDGEGFDPVGDYSISGVPGTGSPVKVTFHNPAGSATGLLFPTEKLSDRVAVPGLGKIDVTIIDATNLFIFAPYSTISSKNPALPDNQSVWDRTEHIRRSVAVEMGLASDLAAVPSNTPKISFVYPPPTSAEQFSETPRSLVVARMASVGDMHPSYAFTGAVATAVASSVPGTVVQEATHPSGSKDIEIRHPSGSIDMSVALTSADNAAPIIESVTGFRTARRLMSGFVHVR